MEQGEEEWKVRNSCIANLLECGLESVVSRGHAYSVRIIDDDKTRLATAEPCAARILLALADYLGQMGTRQTVLRSRRRDLIGARPFVFDLRT